MKFWKKDTALTMSRDALRLLLALNFYVLHLWIGIEFEFEAEYVVLGSILLFGPFFCGWLCPFGAASYWMGRVGNKLFPKLQFNIPKPYDTWLRYVRYGLLAFFMYLFVVKGVDYFGDHIAMFKSTEFSWGYLKLKHLAVLLFSLFIPQFFCKYLCFQKAGYNLLNKFLPVTNIARDADACIGCKKCDRVCPVQITPSVQKTIAGGDCMGCYNCLDTDVCPSKAQALSLRFLGGRVNHKHFILAAMIVYIICTYLVLFVLQW